MSLPEPSAPPPGDRGALEAYRDSIYQRLDLGYERIARGLAGGEEVATWEEFWVELLREYERVLLEIEASQ